MSTQDEEYLEHEADAFFERNHADAATDRLRRKKREIVEAVASCGIEPRRVLEYGCNYGDLLDYYATRGAERCVGVEPSAKAVEFGRDAYGDSIELHRGTIAENPVRDDAMFGGFFDLVVVDDVFCWVSRETIFASVANIDRALADGGHLFIREFLPPQSVRNVNRHVAGDRVYCYKPARTHASMFLGAGSYEVVWRRVWIDADDAWVKERGASALESRWQDVLLEKSWSKFFAPEGNR